MPAKPGRYTTGLLFKAPGTFEAVLAGTKDVTRRLAGDLVRCPYREGALAQCYRRAARARGKPLAEVRITSAIQTPLSPITQEEVRREGFPTFTPRTFVEMFLEMHELGVRTNPIVWRVQFELALVYLPDGRGAGWLPCPGCRLAAMEPDQIWRGKHPLFRGKRVQETVLDCVGCGRHLKGVAMIDGTAALVEFYRG